MQKVYLARNRSRGNNRGQQARGQAMASNQIQETEEATRVRSVLNSPARVKIVANQDSADEPISPDSHDRQDLTITVEQSISMYTVYRHYLIHEDDLVHQRTTWSITIQGFIVAAFGLAFSNRLSISQGQLIDSHQYVILILALATLGLGVSLICLFSVRAAQLSIRGLGTRWTAWHEKHPWCPDYPPLTGGGVFWATYLGHALPILLQGFFVSFWIVVIALQISFKAGIFDYPF